VWRIKDDLIMNLGQRIRELRGKKDISLRELAKALDISAAFLSDIELGRRFPSDKVLSGMAKALDTTVEDLRAYDTRVPVEEIKRLANSDPMYNVFFRKVIDKKISAKKLMEKIEEINPQSKQK
jgi:transcriptional regulator with XRE-family HTH domain